MDPTEEQIMIIGPENFLMIDGKLAMNWTGTFRLVDAVARGLIEGDVEVARELREQARAGMQAQRGLN